MLLLLLPLLLLLLVFLCHISTLKEVFDITIDTFSKKKCFTCIWRNGIVRSHHFYSFHRTLYIYIAKFVLRIPCIFVVVRTRLCLFRHFAYNSVNRHAVFCLDWHNWMRVFVSQLLIYVTRIHHFVHFFSCSYCRRISTKSFNWCNFTVDLDCCVVPLIV